MDAFPVTINAPRQLSAVVKWDLGPVVSYEDLILLGLNADTVYELGTVLGKVTTGAQTVGAPVAGAGNTGNGVFTPANPAADPLAQAGTWRVEFIGVAANGGFFVVLRPDGTVDGYGKVGTAYTGGIKFTIADGAADFVMEDFFTQPVSYAAGSGKYVIMDPAAIDGSQNFAAILGERVFIPANTDVHAMGMVRDGVVLSSALLWKDGVTNNQIAAALAQAAVVRIITKADG
jgi:hypothetical protein